jgi:hypothetical protein
MWEENAQEIKPLEPYEQVWPELVTADSWAGELVEGDGLGLAIHRPRRVTETVWVPDADRSGESMRMTVVKDYVSEGVVITPRARTPADATAAAAVRSHEYDHLERFQDDLDRVVGLGQRPPITQDAAKDLLRRAFYAAVNGGTQFDLMPGQTKPAYDLTTGKQEEGPPTIIFQEHDSTNHGKLMWRKNMTADRSAAIDAVLPGGVHPVERPR